MDTVFADLDMFELHDYLTSRHRQPEPLSRAAWTRLDVAARRAHNDERLRYIQSDFIIQTVQLQQFVQHVAKVQRQNRPRSTGRRMVLIDGPSGSGKTTMLIAAGIAQARATAAEAPQVVGVEVPAPCTSKSLLQEFLIRVCVEPPKRATTSELMRSVVSTYNRLGITRVLVDEVQHLAYRHQSAVDAANTLKSLANKLTATVVYAGVNIRDSHLMTGMHGAQLARRSERIPTAESTLGSEDGQIIWNSIIRAFENHMGLLDHEVGLLMAEAGYLFNRTGGSVGTLRNLIVDSAVRVIEAQNDALRVEGASARVLERIGVAELDAEHVDMAAERFAEIRGAA